MKKIRDKNKLEDLHYKNLIKCTNRHFKFVFIWKIMLKRTILSWLRLTFRER